ncbi:MAG: TetR/AcrR family transcriptional regulator [Acidimicrobiia bacterium]
MTVLADPVAPSVPGIHERAAAATLSCLARHGISKTTIDDIAREAGCSRATLYRYFGGKAELVQTVVRAEAARVAGTVRAAADTTDTLEDAVVAMLHTAGYELGEHPALRFVADFEPERLLPHLTFAGGERFLARAGAAIAPSLERFLPGRAERAAEWVARVGLTLWLCPSGPVSLVDPVSLRAYVRAFVVPALDRILPDPALTFSPKG